MKNTANQYKPLTTSKMQDKLILGLLLMLWAFSCSAEVEDNVTLVDFTPTLESSFATDTVNPFSSFLKSAVVPGWGELSLGSKSGIVFISLEALLWSGRIYLGEEVKLLERDAYIYALANANLKPGSYDDEFLHRMTKHNSSGFEAGGYNEYVVKQARSLYPNSPDEQNQYILENAILDENLTWKWESREQRRQYGIKRKNADHNRDYIKSVTGAIVANHLISAINSLRIAKRGSNQSKVSLSAGFSSQRTPFAYVHYRF